MQAAMREVTGRGLPDEHARRTRGLVKPDGERAVRRCDWRLQRDEDTLCGGAADAGSEAGVDERLEKPAANGDAVL